MEHLTKRANEIMAKHPELKDDVWEILAMCQGEIDDGESIDNEVELAQQSLSELLENNDTGGLGKTYLEKQVELFI